MSILIATISSYVVALSKLTPTMTIYIIAGTILSVRFTSQSLALTIHIATDTNLFATLSILFVAKTIVGPVSTIVVLT